MLRCVLANKLTEGGPYHVASLFVWSGDEDDEEQTDVNVFSMCAPTSQTSNAL